MRYLVIFSGDYPDIALAELEAVTKTKVITPHERIGMVSTKPAFSRLAYAKRIYILLFTSTNKNLPKKINSYSWNKIYKKDFAVQLQKFTKTNLTARELSSLIWPRLKKPKVNLTSPTTKIEFILTKSKIYCCKLLHENKQDFQSRKPHHRPGLSPTSLNPKLARAMVNLTGGAKGETIVDPFCGTGGLLIEAGLLGIKPIGYDIDPVMVRKALSNLKHYNINAKVELKDALEINRKFNYIVTDLPYGLSSKIKPRLYTQFFKKLNSVCQKTAVIGLPDFIDYKKYTRNLNITRKFTYYLHSSLSKRILVVSFK